MMRACTPVGYTAGLPVGDILVEIAERQINNGPVRHTATFKLKADRLATAFESDNLNDLSEAVVMAIAVIDDFEGTSRLLTLAERWRERIASMDSGEETDNEHGGDS